MLSHHQNSKIQMLWFVSFYWEGIPSLQGRISYLEKSDFSTITKEG